MPHRRQCMTHRRQCMSHRRQCLSHRRQCMPHRRQCMSQPSVHVAPPSMHVSAGSVCRTAVSACLAAASWWMSHRQFARRCEQVPFTGCFTHSCLSAACQGCFVYSGWWHATGTMFSYYPLCTKTIFQDSFNRSDHKCFHRNRFHRTAARVRCPGERGGAYCTSAPIVFLVISCHW